MRVFYSLSSVYHVRISYKNETSIWIIFLRGDLLMKNKNYLLEKFRNTLLELQKKSFFVHSRPIFMQLKILPLPNFIFVSKLLTLYFLVFQNLDIHN